MPKKKYKYDVAISFAGENRKIAEKLVASLKAKDERLSVFYDKDHKAYLWGKDVKEFNSIYSSDARYVIPIISEYYIKKDWPRHEFAVASKEAKKRKGEFILPLRVDDACLVGLHDDVSYMDIRKDKISHIVDAVLTKCRDASKLKKGQKKCRNKDSILSRSSRDVLGIIATCVFPTELVNFKKIFPNIKWHSEVNLLTRKGFLARQKRCLNVPEKVKNILVNNPKDAHESNMAWIEALEPLKHHTDIAVMLSMHYMHLRKFDKAIRVSTNAVERMEPDWLSGLYLTFFKRIIKRERSIHIKPETKVRLYNAIGLCLSHTGKNVEAIEWFLKLKHYSSSCKDTWGIGQSYINCGVAYQKSNNLQKAKTYYIQAIKYAKVVKDGLLLSHALNNLAYITADDSFEKAEELIKKSLSIKTHIKDYAGQLTSYGTLGYLAACKDKLKKAEKCFSKLQKKANNLGFSHSEAMAFFNLGNVYFDWGQFSKALVFYEQSYVIAEKYGYAEIAEIAIEGKAKAYFEKGCFRKAELKFRELFEFVKKTWQIERKLIALDGIGASLIKQKKFLKARKILKEALKLSYKLMDLDMIVKLSIYKALTYDAGTLGKTAIKILEKDASNAQKSEKYLIALKLWISCIAELLNLNKETNHIEKALNNGIACVKKLQSNYETQIKFWAYLHFWQWHKRDYQAGIKTLKNIERIAVKGKLWEDQTKAIDQRGVCLQELGELDKAELAHQKSLMIARRIRSKDCIQMSLNNLGEVYRKTNKLTKAIVAYIKAEHIANETKDYESEISTAYNRALALESKGKLKEAEQLLNNCCNRSKRLNLWREYIRSWEALGNLAWYNENYSLATKRYEKALLEAKNYKQRDVQPEIALNLARILLYRGKTKYGLQILEPYEDAFSHIVNSYEYYGTLAELYEENNKLDLAEKKYSLAKQSASVLGNRNRMTYFCSALAELHKKRKQIKLSDTELRHAIANEDAPENLANLLIQRFSLLLANNREKIAKQIFQQARNLISKHNFTGLNIDIHMILGDYNWKGNYKSKFNAMQAYILALGEGYLYNTETSSNISCHIMEQLLEQPINSFEKLINNLEKDINQWLLKQNGINDYIAQCLIWPLRVARKIHPYRLKPHQLGKATKRIIKEEMLALSGTNQTK